MDSARPTMNDVAAAAGVSLKTVSRVVNQEPGVRRELVERVEAQIVRLRYRRNDVAGTLRSRRSVLSVGLVLEDLANPFSAAVARGVELVAVPRGAVLLTASSGGDAERERELLLDLCRRGVGGLIIVPTAPDHAFLRQQVELGVQLVFLDRPAVGARGDTVLLDNRGGAASAVRQLVAHGHRRIAFVGAEANKWTVTERLAGHRSVLVEAGIPDDPELVRLGCLSSADASAAVDVLLDLPQPPTAIFAENNLMTIGALVQLGRRRQTLEIAGFDDIPTAPLFRDPVSLVAYDPVEVGRRAATLVFERIGGRERVKSVMVPTTLVSYGAT